MRKRFCTHTHLNKLYTDTKYSYKVIWSVCRGRTQPMDCRVGVEVLNISDTTIFLLCMNDI